jgi:hypothetical protein
MNDDYLTCFHIKICTKYLQNKRKSVNNHNRVIWKKLGDITPNE